MNAINHELAAAIYYPETDGKPMGETDFHIKLIIDISEALQNYFVRQSDVYVSRDLLLYYEPDNTRKFVVPDIFVVRGVSKGTRRTYKLWEEGRPPGVVIEISSRDTKNVDLNSKRDLYEQIGVAEYYVFDPEYRYIKPPFRAWRLSGGRYVEIAVINGRVRSDELGLELVDTGLTLRLFNPARGEFLLTPEEEAAARQQAEARAEILAAKLRELGVDPDKL